jgi:hypothetical protein
MKLLMISAFAAVALFAAATSMLRSNLPSNDGRASGMPSLQELQSTADVNKLPIEEFEDRSLVYSNEKKR